MTLTIGEPGSGGALELVDGAGKPVPGRKVVVLRPAGPLTERYWPVQVESDGAGLVRIPPLEAGTHRLRVEGVAKEQTLVVPALTGVAGLSSCVWL